MEDLNSVFIYLNKDDEIIQIKESKIHLETPNFLSKMDLIYKIQSMKKNEFGNFIIKYISLFHVDLKKDDLINYLDSNHEKSDTPFLKEVGYLSDISLNETLEMFYPLSTLYFFYKEKVYLNNNTKKIVITDHKKKNKKSLKRKF